MSPVVLMSRSRTRLRSFSVRRNRLGRCKGKLILVGLLPKCGRIKCPAQSLDDGSSSCVRRLHDSHHSRFSQGTSRHRTDGYKQHLVSSHLRLLAAESIRKMVDRRRAVENNSIDRAASDRITKVVCPTLGFERAVGDHVLDLGAHLAQRVGQLPAGVVTPRKKYAPPQQLRTQFLCQPDALVLVGDVGHVEPSLLCCGGGHGRNSGNAKGARRLTQGNTQNPAALQDEAKGILACEEKPVKTVQVLQSCVQRTTLLRRSKPNQRRANRHRIEIPQALKQVLALFFRASNQDSLPIQR